MQALDEKIAKAWREHQSERAAANKELDEAVKEAGEKHRRRILASYYRYQQVREQYLKEG